MTEIATTTTDIVPASPHDEDLSRQIEQSMERQPDERIKAVRVYDDYYRCNWWVQDKTPHALWLVTGVIRRSRFLRVTKTGDGLLIDDVR